MKNVMKKTIAVVMLVLLMTSGVCAMAQAAAQSEQVAGEQSAGKQLDGKVKIVLVNKGKLFYGDKVTLKAVVKVNMAYTLQWQVKENDEWKDIKGETGKTFSFILAPDNRNSQFRVVVADA